MDAPSLGSAELWARFGLAGLVIFALFVSLIFFVILVVKKFDKIDERNVNANNTLLEQHRVERSEWRDSSTHQLDKFETAINKLADGIRDTR